MSETIVFPLRSSGGSLSFIATADLHLGKKLYNFPELEEDLKDNLVRLVDLAIAKKVQYLVIAGDLFEANDNVKPYNITFVSRQVARLRESGIKLIGIAGDHDKPLKGECWIRISGVEPVTIVPEFAGIDYFDYSSVTIEEIVAMLKKNKDPNKVLWIFLHCQFPQIFSRAEPKKTIDFNRMMLFENFPNIQGIIAGDLHFAPETKAYGVGHEAYVGYPGSLGIIDISEANDNKHVLYCDGKNLMHLAFPQRRKWKQIVFRKEIAVNFDVTEEINWAMAEKYKPVIKFSWDSDSDQYLGKLTALYDHALVKLQQVPVKSLDTEEDTLSCRSAASSDAKIDKALRFCCEDDDELYQLSSNLLKDEVKDTLDVFKSKFNL
jgi:DNA repair exonuclease SbcCD nuclease subunit